MKKIIYCVVCILAGGYTFGQQTLQDGIYVVEQTKHNLHIPLHNKAQVQFNPAFVTEDPENYESLLVDTNDYFPFARAGSPVMKTEANNNTALLLQLTETARQQLHQFTARNLQKKIVVVINNAALAVYSTDKPVNSRLIIVTKCSKQACRQLFDRLNEPSSL